MMMFCLPVTAKDYARYSEPEPNSFVLYELGYGNGGVGNDLAPRDQIFMLGTKFGNFFYPGLFWHELGGHVMYEAGEARFDRLVAKPEATLGLGLGAIVAVKGGVYLPLRLAGNGIASTTFGTRFSSCVFGFCIFFAREWEFNKSLAFDDKAGIYLSFPICTRERNCLGSL